MLRASVNLTTEDLKRVLDYYDIGQFNKTEALKAGNAHAPKRIIYTDRGQFLLKRRAKGKDDAYHVAFAHAVQLHLEKKGFPVPGIITTAKQQETALSLDGFVYELFRFIQGERYDGSIEAVMDTGRKLAMFHQYLRDFASNLKPIRRTFHDSPSVRRHLKILGSQPGSRHRDKNMRQIAYELTVHYNHASVHVNQLGFDSWEKLIVHGDWHPGNMLFSSQKVVAVFDFDSVKVAQAATDLANAALQFSIISGNPQPIDWPDRLDIEKLANFVAGYKDVANMPDDMLQSLLDEMIETMIAEAVLPIATTGFFGHLSGLDFLEMIRRKCNWINENRKTLTEAILD